MLDLFYRSFAALAFHDPDSGYIARPSELLRSVSVMQRLLAFRLMTYYYSILEAYHDAYLFIRHLREH